MPWREGCPKARPERSRQADSLPPGLDLAIQAEQDGEQDG